jgi:hypothetical protein
MVATKQSYIVSGLADRIIDACSDGVEMTLRAIESSAKAKAPVRQLTPHRGIAKTEVRKFREANPNAPSGRGWVTKRVRVVVKQKEMLRIDVKGETAEAKAKAPK